MSTFRTRLRTAFVSLVRDESGATLAEYSIIMTVLTIGMMAAFTVVGNIGASRAATNQTNLTASSVTAP